MRTPWGHGGSVTAPVRSGVAALLALAVLTAVGILAPTPGPSRAAARRFPTLSPANTVIDGPSAAIVSLDGMSMSRDGTGGLIYVKDVSGVAHVFVSRLLGGAFQTPVQIDAGLPGPSAQPVIAAGQGGLLLAAFINGGQLYEVSAATSATALGAPAALYAAAANPSLSVSNFGKGYLAFTATDGAGGGDVRTAFYFQGQWALETAPLDGVPADGAGIGAGRPQVVAAGDGVAIVAWGESGHIFTRRVTGTTPSVVDEEADAPAFAGWQEVSASDPVIAAGGDSTYAAVSFVERLSNGSARQSRVLIDRLHGSQYDGIVSGDGTSNGAPEGAAQPAVADTEYGQGFETSTLGVSHELFETTLATNDSPQGTFRVDSLPNSGMPDAAPANAGLVSTFVAWQQDPGVAGLPEIRMRYAPDGVDLNPEQIISSPALGPTDADRGLVTAGDVSGDAAIAWVQGTGAASQIVAAQLFQTPGGFVAVRAFSYSTTPVPVLAWTGAAELWGSPQYTLRIDGSPVATTTATQAGPPLALANGRHSYLVTATNLAGLSTNDKLATVFVDTVAPQLSVRVTGTRIVKSRLRLQVGYADDPPAGLPPSAASGVATVAVNWGDGVVDRIRRSSASHVFTRTRRYIVTVVAVDRAANRTAVVTKVRIKPKPKPKRKHRRHKPTRKKATRHRGATTARRAP